MDATAPALAATAKRFRLGTHRTCTPEATWERIAELLPLAGVTRVADLTRLDRVGIPVFQAVRPASRNLAVAQGKGATPAAARVSAAMEALELWHAECLDDLPQTAVSLREMRSANALPLRDLRWHPGVRPLDAVPIRWIEAEPLGGGEPLWLPRQMLELDFRLPDAFEVLMFVKTSSGLASGNCREEAVLHGLCELVERHGLARFLRDRSTAVPIAPESVTDESCRELIGRCRATGARLALWDATWEAGVPTLIAEFVLPDLPSSWRGAGCHPAPEVALSRALTEAAQSRLTYISGARDDLIFEANEADEEADRVWQGFVEHPEGRRFTEVVSLATESVDDDLAQVLSRLGSLGLTACAVDLTRRGIGLPVFFVYVPGLLEPPHD
ncbi:MAG TPA: YcaO-like family protein [Thermoanaerobaculia bacterium]|nr:YcaO-like family protein [Thermoanaerobaculia bacterium]